MKRIPPTVDLAPDGSVRPADTAVNLVLRAAAIVALLDERSELWEAARLRDLPELERALIQIEQGAISLRRAHLGGTWLDRRRK